MEWMYWLIIWLVFIIGFVGLIYPIIPSVLFIVGGMLLYGVFFSFEPFSWFFWIIQGMFVLLLFGADYLVNLFGVKKFGGSKAGVWGTQGSPENNLLARPCLEKMLGSSQKIFLHRPPYALKSKLHP